MAEPDPEADDHYARLGVDPEASVDRIEQQGREVLQRIREEANDPATAREHHYRVQESIDILTDQSKRRAYDADRTGAGPSPDVSNQSGDAAEVPITLDLPDGPVTPGETATVRVHTGDSDDGLAGVVVVAETGERDTTGEDGTASLELSPPDPVADDRTVELAAQRAGTTVATGTVELADRVETRSFDVETDAEDGVPAGEPVRVRVVDAVGEPIAGAEVRMSVGDRTRRAETDTDGEVSLTVESPGEATVVAEPPDGQVNGRRLSGAPATTRLRIEPPVDPMSDGDDDTDAGNDDEPGESAGTVRDGSSGTEPSGHSGGSRGSRDEGGGGRSTTSDRSSPGDRDGDDDRLQLSFPSYQSRTVEADESVTVEVRGSDGTRVGRTAEVTVVDGERTAAVRTGRATLTFDDPGTYNLRAQSRSTAGPDASDSLTVEVTPETAPLELRPVGSEFRTHEPIEFRLSGDPDVPVTVRAVGRDRSARVDEGRAELTFTEPGRVDVEASPDRDGADVNADGDVRYEPDTTTIDVRRGSLDVEDPSPVGEATDEGPGVAAPIRIGLFALGLVTVVGGVIVGNLPLVVVGTLLVLAVVVLTLT